MFEFQSLCFGYDVMNQDFEVFMVPPALSALLYKEIPNEFICFYAHLIGLHICSAQFQANSASAHTPIASPRVSGA